jgi:Tol biopolymer transport system component
MNISLFFRVRFRMCLALLLTITATGISLVAGCSIGRSLPTQATTPSLPTPRPSLQPTATPVPPSPTSTLTPLPQPTVSSVSPSPTSTPSLKPPSPLTSDVRPLAILDLSLASPLHERDFDWSPDGQVLAFASGKSASQSSDYHLWVARAPDFALQRLTEQDGHQPRWSPDGEHVAFVSCRRTGDRQPETIWLVRADGSDLRDLLPGEKAIRSVSGAKFIEHWLNEKTLIFADHCGTGCRRLVALDTRTGETQDFPLGGAQYRWAPSRDKYVAIAGGGIPQTSLWERIDSGAWRETLLPRPSEFYAWSPDSRAFLFSHWPWEAGQGPPYAVTSHVPMLYVWNVAQGQAKELFSGAYQGAWSPDGERIAFFLLGEPVYDEELRLWGTDLVPGEPFVLSLAIWDVPSEHVVAVIVLQEQMDVAEYVEVGLQSWFAVRQPVWSPDSQQLIYWGEGYDIWVVDRNGTEPRRLTHGLEVVEVVWSPDGSKLVFATAHRLYVVGRP